MVPTVPWYKFSIDISILTSVAVYLQVQTYARAVLAKFYSQYNGSQRLIVPSLCDLLITPPPKVTEEQFKVSLLFCFDC